MTYNMKNKLTNYQSGIDAHIDRGGSRLLTKDLRIGAAGYYDQQLTPDSGQRLMLHPFALRRSTLAPIRARAADKSRRT
jgi:hypothetical protein